MIGIGITTHNRRETALYAISEIKRMAPQGSKVVIVDDASDIPYPGADFRFEQNAGIAKAKNKCFELLEGCEHVFLFDDDVFPIKEGWYKPYVYPDINHMCFTFKRPITVEFESHYLFGSKLPYICYELPCGLMLYYKSICLETVGGFDEEYNGYGYEHVDLSKRIFNAGLTLAPFMDYSDSLSLFYSYDYLRQIQPSSKNRALTIPANKLRYDALGDSKEFKPYKS